MVDYFGFSSIQVAMLPIIGAECASGRHTRLVGFGFSAL
jgi:hypothetical protein